MRRATLSLCIPAYNAAWCLPRLLESARVQEIPFDEILVYDDCSTDETAKVARKYGAEVIAGEINVGCSAGKNALLKSTSCTWLHFHDADDDLLPNFTKLAHRWISSDEQCPEVVLFDYEYRDLTSGQLLAKSNFDPAQLKEDPVRYAILTQINPFCGIYDTAKLCEVSGYDLDPEILFNEDVAFHCKLAVNGFSFGVEKEVSIINYRVSDSMSQKNAVRCLNAHVAVMRRVSAQTEGRYAREIQSRLWRAACGLASYRQWTSVDCTLDLARDIAGGRPPAHESPAFRFLVRIFGSKLAFRIREQTIRLIKPALRA